MLYNEKGDAIEVLQMPMLQALEKEKRIVWPNITEDEIKDRSKGDDFSKAFAVVQTTWFVTQCIARGVTGLVVTELELATVAFAVLNGILYFLWWYKPLDVACPLPVYLLPSRQEAGTQAADSEHGETPDHSISKAFSDSSSISDEYEDEEFSAEGDLSARKLESNPEDPPAALHQPSVWTFFARKAMDTVLLPFRVFWLPIKLMATQYHIPPSDSPPLSVPTFYAPCQVIFTIPIFIGVGVGVTFGGIHCIGWSFGFLSVEEKWMWRLSALTITAVPFLAALTMSAVSNTSGIVKPIQLIVERMMGGWIETFCAVAYFLSRLLLLILPLIALRSLPPKALLDLNWSAFLPHV